MTFTAQDLAKHCPSFAYVCKDLYECKELVDLVVNHINNYPNDLAHSIRRLNENPFNFGQALHNLYYGELMTQAPCQQQSVSPILPSWFHHGPNN